MTLALLDHAQQPLVSNNCHRQTNCSSFVHCPDLFHVWHRQCRRQEIEVEDRNIRKCLYGYRSPNHFDHRPFNYGSVNRYPPA